VSHKRVIGLTGLALALAVGVVGAVRAAPATATGAAVVADVYMHGPRGSDGR